MIINRYYNNEPIKKDELENYTVVSKSVISAINRAEGRVENGEDAEG